jgi:hypothetical protein
MAANRPLRASTNRDIDICPGHKTPQIEDISWMHPAH